MGVREILLIIFCAVAVIGIVVATVINKKKGKGGCTGDCANCGCCCSAASKKPKKQDK